MNDGDGIEQLGVIFDRALVFLGRPEVHEQLLVLIGVLLLSRLASRGVWWTIGRLRLRHARRRTGDHALTAPAPFGLTVQAIEAISAPLLGIAMAKVALEELTG